MRYSDTAKVAMPLRNGRLTPLERRFADEVVASGNPVYAAHRAGYGHPPSAASRNMQHPIIQGEIAKRTWARLENEGLPLAYERLHEALSDRKVTGPTLARLIAITFTEARKNGETVEDKLPSEMDAAELYRAAERARLSVEALEREAAERARPVEAARVEAEDIFD